MHGLVENGGSLKIEGNKGELELLTRRLYTYEHTWSVKMTIWVPLFESSIWIKVKNNC